jgi:hypothetical protein
MQPQQKRTQRMRTLEARVSQMQAGDDQAFAQLFYETTPFVAKTVRATLHRYAPGRALPVTVAEVVPDIVADMYMG